MAMRMSSSEVVRVERRYQTRGDGRLAEVRAVASGCLRLEPGLPAPARAGHLRYRKPMRFAATPGAGQLLAVGGVLLLLVGVVVVAPAALDFETPRAAPAARTVEGTVARVLEERLESSPRGEILTRQLEVATGGRIVTVEQQLVSRSERMLAAAPGDRVLLASTEGPGAEQSYFIVDRVRRSLLVFLAVLFSLFVVAVGGWQGARSLVGLAVSFAVILRFVVPGVISGYDPVA